MEKSAPSVNDRHHEACQVMTNGDPEGQINIPSDSFSCSPFNTAFFKAVICGMVGLAMAGQLF